MDWRNWLFGSTTPLVPPPPQAAPAPMPDAPDWNEIQRAMRERGMGSGQAGQERLRKFRGLAPAVPDPAQFKPMGDSSGVTGPFYSGGVPFTPPPTTMPAATAGMHFGGPDYGDGVQSIDVGAALRERRASALPANIDAEIERVRAEMAGLQKQAAPAAAPPPVPPPPLHPWAGKYQPMPDMEAPLTKDTFSSVNPAAAGLLYGQTGRPPVPPPPQAAPAAPPSSPPAPPKPPAPTMAAYDDDDTDDQPVPKPPSSIKFAWGGGAPVAWNPGDNLRSGKFGDAPDVPDPRSQKLPGSGGGFGGATARDLSHGKPTMGDPLEQKTYDARLAHAEAVADDPLLLKAKEREQEAHARRLERAAQAQQDARTKSALELSTSYQARRQQIDAEEAQVLAAIDKSAISDEEKEKERATAQSRAAEDREALDAEIKARGGR